MFLSLSEYLLFSLIFVYFLCTNKTVFTYLFFLDSNSDDSLPFIFSTSIYTTDTRSLTGDIIAIRYFHWKWVHAIMENIALLT